MSASFSSNARVNSFMPDFHMLDWKRAHAEIAPAQETTYTITF
jgi:hypothetical protein